MKIKTVHFKDGRVVEVKDMNLITEAWVGLCLYENNWDSTLYPWHMIEKVVCTGRSS
jgi:hypothetical protein